MYVDSNVPQAIIMVCRVFIVDSRLEREAAGGHIGNDPFTVPLGVAIPSYGVCSKPHRWVMFVSCWKIRAQRCEDVRIRSHSVDVCHWKFESAVEGEFDIEAWRRSWSRRVVKPAGWLIVIFLTFAMFGGFALEFLRFLIEFGSVAYAAMAIGLLGGHPVVDVELGEW